MPESVSRRRFLAAAALTTGRAAAEMKPDSGIAAVKQILARKEPAVWVFTGDSITHGAHHTLGSRSYPEHFAERVRWEMRRLRDVVINTGIGWDTTDRLLADLDWRVLQFKPAVVSVMEGMNDCSGGPGQRQAFHKNLAAIVAKVRSGGAVPVLNTTNTILTGRDDLAGYNDVIRRVASETNTALVDHFGYWQKERPTPSKLQSWIEDGRIHPGVYGHRAFAHLIFRTLGIFDPDSPTCKLETP
jgi:lysophospholipase L1-like esterase